MKTFSKTVTCVVILLACTQSYAVTSDGYIGGDAHRLPSAQGPTGLFFMNTAFSLRAGEARVNGTVFYDDETGSDEQLTIAATFTLGITDRFEIAGQVPSVRDTTAGVKSTGTGDGTVLMKWRFHEQNANMPTLAAMLGARLPSASDPAFETVDDIGLISGFLISAEMPWFDSVLGLHLEVQGVSLDPRSDTSTFQQKYTSLAYGITLPISDDDRLNLIYESTTFNGLTVGGISGDWVESIFGVRYMFKYLNFGVAAEKIEIDSAVVSPSRRAVFTIGLGF